VRYGCDTKTAHSSNPLGNGRRQGHSSAGRKEPFGVVSASCDVFKFVALLDAQRRHSTAGANGQPQKSAPQVPLAPAAGEAGSGRYSLLDAAQRLMPLSVASRSISRSSSAENSGLSRAPTFCSSWATLLAPTSVDVTRGSRSVQASAIWASVWPRRRAIWLSARTLPSVCSVSISCENDPSWLAREPAGSPSAD